MSRAAAFGLRRLLQAALTLLLATLVFQGALELLPGDTIRALFGPRRPDPAVYAALQAQYNFDDPFPVRYGKYLGDLLTGDWGNSFPGGTVRNFVTPGPPIVDIVASSVPVSAVLLGGALVLQGVAGLVAGTVSALFRRPAAGGLIYLAAIGMVSVPVIVLAYASQALFAVELRWLPVTGVSAGLRSYVLPVLTLAAASAAYLTLLTRSELLETLRTRWIKAAEARSIPPHRIVGVHALRASLIPVITFLGANLGQLLTGLVVVEGVFGIPGVGGALFDAIQDRDPAVLTALLTLATATVLAGNLVADVLYATVDPRIRLAD